MKTIQDQIKDLEATRAAKAAEMANIAQKAADEGRSMDESEVETFDTLDQEVKAIDADLIRCKRVAQLQSQATPVAPKVKDTTPDKTATQLRGAPAIVVNREAEDKFKGQSFTRIAIAKTLAHIHNTSAVAIAQKRWGKTNPLLVEVIKAAVAGGGSDSGEWGAELVTADGRYTGDFIEFLYSKTVFDQLGFREVPANVTIKGQDGQGTGYWVAQSKGIPVTALDFFNVNLSPLKVAALAVASNELLEDSSPAAESLIRDALVNASSQRIDTTLFSTAAASAGASPAGLLNGLTPIAATGLDADSVRDGIRALYAPFLTAKNASDLVLVMNPARAKAIGLMVNALGQTEFPGLGAQGGVLLGDRVVTGDNVNEAHVILLKPSDIYRIGDTGVQVSISRDATIEQDNAPAGASDTPVDMAAPRVSMFQTESTAIKVVRRINFAKRRASAVAYINDASWGDAAS